MSATPESSGLWKILLPVKFSPHGDCSAVEEFIASDPVHGPTLKAAREAFKFGVLGGAIAAVAGGRWAWKLAKNPKRTAKAFASGGVIAFTYVAEVVGHWYYVQNLDEAEYQHFKWSRKRAREES